MRPDPTYDRPEDVPGTGAAVKLYVPESPGAKWGIAVHSHPDTSWWANGHGGELRMDEVLLRAFVRHAAGVLRMTLIDDAPPARYDMDAETVPVGYPALFAVPTEPATEAWKQ